MEFNQFEQQYDNDKRSKERPKKSKKRKKEVSQSPEAEDLPDKWYQEVNMKLQLAQQ